MARLLVILMFTVGAASASDVVTTLSSTTSMPTTTTATTTPTLHDFASFEFTTATAKSTTSATPTFSSTTTTAPNPKSNFKLQILFANPDETSKLAPNSYTSTSAPSTVAPAYQQANPTLISMVDQYEPQQYRYNPLFEYRNPALQSQQATAVQSTVVESSPTQTQVQRTQVAQINYQNPTTPQSVNANANSVQSTNVQPFYQNPTQPQDATQPLFQSVVSSVYQNPIAPITNPVQNPPQQSQPSSPCITISACNSGNTQLTTPPTPTKTTGPQNGAYFYQNNLMFAPKTANGNQAAPPNATPSSCLNGCTSLSQQPIIDLFMSPTKGQPMFNLASIIIKTITTDASGTKVPKVTASLIPLGVASSDSTKTAAALRSVLSSNGQPIKISAKMMSSALSSSSSTSKDQPIAITANAPSTSSSSTSTSTSNSMPIVIKATAPYNSNFMQPIIKVINGNTGFFGSNAYNNRPRVLYAQPVYNNNNNNMFNTQPYLSLGSSYAYRNPNPCVVASRPCAFSRLGHHQRRRVIRVGGNFGIGASPNYAVPDPIFSNGQRVDVPFRPPMFTSTGR